MTIYLRRTLANLSVLALLANFGCSSTPSAAIPSTDAQASHRYWEKLGQILQRTEKSLALLEQENTADGMSQSLKKSATLLNEAVLDIKALPVLQVDAEATVFAIRHVDLYTQTASLMTDTADWTKEAKAFAAHANSFGAGMDAFVHGFLGDPLTPINNYNAGSNELERQRQALHTRWKQLEQKLNQLSTDELTQRATFAKRYGLEFSKLDATANPAERTFAAADLNAARAKLNAHADAIGATLIRGTHPTGKYGSAALPNVNLSNDGRDIQVSITCFWSGITGKRYQTVFGFAINKQSGLGHLQVISDNATFQIEEGHRATTEDALRSYYRSVR